MSTNGQEVTLSSWHTPTKGDKSGDETWWPSSPQSTAPSDADDAVLNDGMEDSSEGHYKDGEKKKRPCRFVCLLCCILVIAIALGLGLGFGLRDQGESYPPNEALQQVQECADSETQCCNGLESNCRLRVNEMIFAASHNAMSAEQNGFLAANHRFPLEDSLEAGYRALFMDLCHCGDNGLQLCHTVCKAGTRDPMTVFSHIRDFLQTHPTEVLIIELQVSGEKELVANLYGTMLLINGLTEYMYAHPDRSTPWPTMGELVANNTRLIMFQHDGPNCFRKECPPGFHTTYGYMHETSYSFQGVDDVLEYDTSCLITRGNPESDFFVLNHYSNNRLGLPSADLSEQLNQESIVEERVLECQEKNEREVNFIVVDYWASGNVPKVAQQLSMERGVTMQPSLAPSVVTFSPSMAPSVFPSTEPSSSPSLEPSSAPTLAPTTVAPSAASLAPSQQPSSSLTSVPTTAGTGSTSPSSAPSLSTSAPSVAQSPTGSTFPPSISETTAAPTAAPSMPASIPSTESPSSSPTIGSTVSSTASPSVQTDSPTTTPTGLPASPSPSPAPTVTATLPTSPAPTAFPTDAPTQFEEPEPNLGNLVAGEYWTQCSGAGACSNGYDSGKDCLRNDANCPSGETCTVACESLAKQYCYLEASDMCTEPSLQCTSGTAPCPNNAQCVDEFSFECGARVCKDTTIPEDFRACETTSCTIDDDCPGDEMVCASYYQDCGIGI